tara:strand:- start:5070 stop:5411 length:342 start_codon:yes stop_codon:yes gene_type:complete
MSFIAEKRQIWKDFDQVKGELLLLYDKCYGKFPVGQSLYYQHLHFCCPSKIYDPKIIREIKGIKYCMDSGTPPYSDLESTPFDFIQKFEIYNTEIGMIKKDQAEKEQQKKKKK